MAPITPATAYPASSEVLRLRQAAPNWKGDGVALGLRVTDANVLVAVVDGGTNDPLNGVVRDAERVELLLPLAEAVLRCSAAGQPRGAENVYNTDPDPELKPDTVELPLGCDVDAVMLFVDEADD